jgi:hypothetical protein
MPLRGGSQQQTQRGTLPPCVLTAEPMAAGPAVTMDTSFGLNTGLLQRLEALPSEPAVAPQPSPGVVGTRCAVRDEVGVPALKSTTQPKPFAGPSFAVGDEVDVWSQSNGGWEMGTIVLAQPDRLEAQYRNRRKVADPRDPDLVKAVFRAPPTWQSVTHGAEAVIMVDLDNWSRLFKIPRLHEVLPPTTAIVAAAGEKWTVPKGAEATLAHLYSAGRYFFRRAGARSDAADFQLVSRFTALDKELPPTVPITILSGDGGFQELNNETTLRRRPNYLDPHHLPHHLLGKQAFSIDTPSKLSIYP